MMADLIAGGIIAAIVLAAAFYVYKAKKSGKKCIGCPDSGGCSGGGSGSGDGGGSDGDQGENPLG